ncbi:hypothetical protein MMC30_006483 [Trapelia coarctata]|nr:hypothetical protein [Trapelia coarctata]
MAEIGLIASIVSVAGAGLQIAMSLRQLASEIREAAREVHDVATSVSLFSMTLKQVGKCVRDNASPHSESALDTLEEIIMNCRSIFNKIESMVSQVRKDTHRKDDQQSMSSSRRLESSKLTLSIMLQVFSLRTVMEETDRSREGIEAARIEVEHLQAEIQSLVLDRVWVQREEESEMKDAMLQEHTLPSCAQAGPPNDGMRTVSSSNADDEADPEVGNSRALIQFTPNSLSALDASLLETDNSQHNISQNTISRSVIAINYLLDQWTIGTNSDGRDRYAGNRWQHLNGAEHSQSFDRNHSFKSSTRFATFKSACDSSDLDRSFQSGEALPRSVGAAMFALGRQSENAGKGDILQSIPFMPIDIDYNSTPIVSYKTKHPDLIWDITYEGYLEVFNDDGDSFCWGVSDGITRLVSSPNGTVGMESGSIPGSNPPFQLEWNGPRPFQNQWFHVVVIPSEPAEYHLLFRPLLPPPQLRRSSAAASAAVH